MSCNAEANGFLHLPPHGSEQSLCTSGSCTDGLERTESPSVTGVLAYFLECPAFFWMATRLFTLLLCTGFGVMAGFLLAFRNAMKLLRGITQSPYATYAPAILPCLQIREIERMLRTGVPAGSNSSVSIFAACVVLSKSLDINCRGGIVRACDLSVHDSGGKATYSHQCPLID